VGVAFLAVSRASAQFSWTLLPWGFYQNHTRYQLGFKGNGEKGDRKMQCCFLPLLCLLCLDIYARFKVMLVSGPLVTDRNLTWGSHDAMHMQHNGSPIFLLQLHVMKSTSHGFHDKFAAPEHRTNQQIFFLVGEALRHWAVLLACFTVCPNSCGHMDCTMGRGPKALLAKAIKPSGAGRNGGLWSH